MKIQQTKRGRKYIFETPNEGLLFLARMNEQGFCYAVAAKQYREAGDEVSALRCEKHLKLDAKKRLPKKKLKSTKGRTT